MTDGAGQMRALVAERDGDLVRVAVRQVPVPVPGAGEVLVRVALAGVCRTDVLAADGRIRCGAARMILGHELAGVVAGPAAGGLRAGLRVTADPLLACGQCALCVAGQRCARPAMLGVDRPGAFAEYVCLPAASLHLLPDGLPWTLGAYAEPVAAALAVLRAGLEPGWRGLIYGRNRIARLTYQILVAHGFGDVALHDPGAAPPPADSYDFIVESVATTETVAEMVAALRPGGTLVIKSRTPQPVGLHLPALVMKEVRLQAVRYGPFAQALALLAEGRIDTSDLLGPVHPLDEFAQVFALSRTSESDKRFLQPGDSQAEVLATASGPLRAPG